MVAVNERGIKWTRIKRQVNSHPYFALSQIRAGSDRPYDGDNGRLRITA